MSEVIGNRYQITKLIGKGGMAEVYLAWDSILNREVAIKVLKSDMADDDVAIERFKREANATTRLSHPNIVDVYDVGDDGNSHYIVMEYVKGYTLKQLIKKRGAIPYKEAVWMMKQLAGALMEAHRKGIVHRDIKSQNVLIKPDGTIKLSDFGIALANGAMQITSKDSVLGSVHYLAPELSRGKQANMQSDIYSLGIVFYELLTGDVPFKADTPVQVALMHVKNSIPSVRRYNALIPQSVENIVIESTAKNVNNRYKNIALMLKDLNECLKPEHENDGKLIFEEVSNLKTKSNIRQAGEFDSKKGKRFPKFLIVIISFVSIVAIGIILLLSGVLNFKNDMVTVPDIININVLEAKDILAKSNLSIDDTRIEYQLSDSIEKDKIISIDQTVGSEVEPNTKIKIVVSSGIASILDNYVGKNYTEAKKDLVSKKWFVKLQTVSDSTKETGTVVSQYPEQGFKYNAESNNEITLTYAVGDSIILDPSLQGSDLDDVIDYFVENKIPYSVEEVDEYKLAEDVIEKLQPNSVVMTSPELGSSYEYDSNTEVIIYYYKGEE